MLFHAGLRSTPDGPNEGGCMKRAQYVLRVKSGGWNGHLKNIGDEYRLLDFTMTAEREGKPLGGNNIQLYLGAPDQERHGLNEDVALWLASGWWVSLRNQFATAPDVAAEIVRSVAGSLSDLTARAQNARGRDTEAVTAEVFATALTATGPDYWR